VLYASTSRRPVPSAVENKAGRTVSNGSGRGVNSGGQTEPWPVGPRNTRR
jgi:hypothetical protein